MARFSAACFLLTVAASSLSLTCGLEATWTNSFPTSTGGYPTGGDFGSEGIVANHIDDKTSRVMENHLLRMLKLSSRPPSVVAEAAVPGYVQALQLAVDSLPPSAATLNSNDQLTCAIKALQVTATSDVATVDFSVAVKSRDTFPQRVELVFESPSRQSSRHRGRSRVDVCHYSAQVETSCRHYRQVRYRWYSGSGRSYVIYDVTATLWPAWDFCRPQPCRLQFRVYRPGYVDFDNVLTILVVYQNTIPNIRATRRALRSGRSTAAATGRPDSGSERFRRDVGNKSPESATYCRLYKWTVDFRALNWSWIVAPHSFEAGYCAGRCPRDGRDLELANFTNHAFVRMVHRAWSLNTDDGRLPAPSCVGVRYSPLSILYRTDEKTFELRSVNEIVSNECGCL